MTTSADAAEWLTGLDGVVDRIESRRGLGAEPRRLVRAYFRRLLSPIKRKNGWQMAQAACDRTLDGV